MKKSFKMNSIKKIEVIIALIIFFPVASAAPLADFSASASSGTVPLSIEFYDQSSGNATSWNWSFGDGLFSGEQNPVHTFTQSGSFTVSLTVSDGNETDILVKPDFITAMENDSGGDTVSISISDQPPEGTLSLVTVLTPGSFLYGGDMDGDILVFTDNIGEITRIKIYLFDTGTELFLPPVHQDYQQANPAIYGDLVVWEEISRNYMNYSVVLHNLATNESFVISEFSNFVTSAPDIFENKIVWSEHSGESADIYLYDAAIDEKRLLTPGTQDSDEYYPVIFGEAVAWQSQNRLDYMSEIKLLTLSTGEISTPNPSFFNDMDPAMWGDYLAWTGTDPLNWTTDIYLYHIPTGNTVLLTPNTYFSDEMLPDMSGNRVVWQGVDPVAWTQAVFMYDMSTGFVYRIVPDPSDSDQFNPVISGERIAWYQSDPLSWTYDIYLFAIGTELSPLEADFSVNETMGLPPLTVGFTDLSTGSAEGWHWDFGDGNLSSEQNPVHIYTDPGTYTVSLIVHNSAQRSGLEKQDLVSVGSPPIVMFEADMLEGSKPLSIQFSDLSAHNPTYWNWSFGDGFLSTEKNPIHVYHEPGVYNVTLTAGNPFGEGCYTETNYICVMDGVIQYTNFTLPGIIVLSGDPQSVMINTTLCTPASGWNQTLLPVYIPYGCGVDEIIFYSWDGEGFHECGDNLISGTLSSVQFTSSMTCPEIRPNWNISYCLNTSVYPDPGLMKSEVWENATESDYWLFKDTAIAPNFDDPQNTYDDVVWVAYTIRFGDENLSSPCNASLIFGINATWVSEYGWGSHGTIKIESNMEEAKILVDGQFEGYTPLTVHGIAPGEHVATAIMSGFEPIEKSFTIVDERDSIHVIRIGDDGSGEVLDSRFLYHDPATNMDYFQAESPAGLSTFGVAALSKSENPLQLLYLTIVKLMGGTGGGGGGASSVSSMPGENPTPFATIASASVGNADVIGEQTPSAPKVTKTQAAATIPPKTPDVTSTDSQLPSPEIPPMFVILNYLSVVFVVVLVSMIFYIRWRRREGGD